MDQNTVIKVYTSFVIADRARNALLSSGFSAADIELTSNQDEAGPVQGNFAIGNGNLADPSYGGNFADAEQRGTYTLVVATADRDQCERANSLLEEFQAHDALGEHIGDNVRHAGKNPPLGERKA